MADSTLPPDRFNEEEYLTLHSDVAAAVRDGRFKNGWHHYELFGRSEGRAVSRPPIDMDALRNPGIAFMNTRPAPSQATVMVVGVPRSGTSMTAAVLDALGIYLGSKADRAVFEDAEISRAVERNAESLPDVIARCNERHDVWGFKRPLAFRHLGASLPLFRNPRFVVMFRDPLAIAARNQASMGADISEALRSACEMTGELTAFVRCLTAPAMLVSYEKALADPSTFVGRLAEFCGLAITEDHKKSAVAVVQNGPELYLTESQVRYRKTP